MGTRTKKEGKIITSIDGKERWMDIISNRIETLPGIDIESLTFKIYNLRDKDVQVLVLLE